MKRLLTVCLFCLFSVNLHAAFTYNRDPNIIAYNFENTAFDFYIGASIGTSVTDSFDYYTVESHYYPLFFPTKFLDSGTTSLKFGFRFFENKNTALNNFRFEGEWLYIYHWTTPIVNTSIVDSSVDTSSYPKKGQQVLKNAVAFNIYYDFRGSSNLIYPYFGIGAGAGDVRFLFVDLKQQPNGRGEQYHGEKKMPFVQFMLGIEYSTKVIKSSYFFEYKFLSTAAMKISPHNDGISGAQDPDSMPDNPTTFDRSVVFNNHSLTFGLKYYLN